MGRSTYITQITKRITHLKSCTSKRNIEVNDIFGNPIYESLIGSYKQVNQTFDGNFNLVIADLKQTFGLSRPAA